MVNRLKNFIRKNLIEKLGVTLARESRYTHADELFGKLYNLVEPLSMVNEAGLYLTYQAAKNIAQNSTPGAIVECGVWRGGASILIAETLNAMKITDKTFYLYDTFSGMSKPTELDVKSTGLIAHEKFNETYDPDTNETEWCLATLSEVKSHVIKCNYPYENFRFIQGKVEDTIPAKIPQRIALLRLDTDWYESTKHELEHLYNLVVPGGIVIIDDYTAWAGSRKATDDFIGKLKTKPVIYRDPKYGGIMLIKY